MTFVSFEFCILFFPIFFGLYFSTYKNVKTQNTILLIGNILFYSSYGLKYFFVLLLCTTITYLGGMLGWKSKQNSNKIYFASFILNIFVLCLFKYFNSAINICNSIFPVSNTISLPQILLPTGISFYVFQSSTYLFDLKNKKYDSPERSLLDYFIFVSFFPTIVSGPIQRSRDLLPQLKKGRTINYHELQISVLMFLYGAFIKYVIADRINEFTTSVYADIDSVSSITLLVCAFSYSIQIYADFAGYSLMAVAVSKALGINVDENFRQPYLAVTIPDFWRRWHISLTSWLTEYIYIPLGGSRKGTARKYLNIFIVFLISGIWHGSTLSFVVWGGLHGFYQIFGYITKPIREKLCHALRINRDSAIYKYFQRIIVFVLVTISWIFFRADNLKQAFIFIKNIVHLDLSKGLIPQSNTLWATDIIIIIISVLVMFAFSLVKENVDLFVKITTLKFTYKVLIVILMFFIIAFFGYFGGCSSSSFIYAGF